MWWNYRMLPKTCGQNHFKYISGKTDKLSIMPVPVWVFIFVLSTLLCYFKVKQVYTVKHNTSNINMNTLYWRHVSDHIVANFRPYTNLEQTRITALGCRRHLLSTSVIKTLVESCSLMITNILTTTFNQDFNNRCEYHMSPTPKCSDLCLIS
jgi:hypothetical protein